MRKKASLSESSMPSEFLDIGDSSGQTYSYRLSFFSAQNWSVTGNSQKTCNAVNTRLQQCIWKIFCTCTILHCKCTLVVTTSGLSWVFSKLWKIANTIHLSWAQDYSCIVCALHCCGTSHQGLWPLLCFCWIIYHCKCDAQWIFAKLFTAVQYTVVEATPHLWISWVFVSKYQHCIKQQFICTTFCCNCKETSLQCITLF